MTRPDDVPEDVWTAAREGLAVEYEVLGRAGPYPSYANLARNGEGDFTLCSILAIARAILAERERCVAAVLGEKLEDPTACEGDQAYDVALDHAVYSIRAGATHANT